MKDFMTKISDYLNERRNDPERRENQLSIVIIGAVAVVVIILLLLPEPLRSQPELLPSRRPSQQSA